MLCVTDGIVNSFPFIVLQSKIPSYSFALKKKILKPFPNSPYAEIYLNPPTDLFFSTFFFLYCFISPLLLSNQPLVLFITFNQVDNSEFEFFSILRFAKEKGNQNHRTNQLRRQENREK